MYGTILVFIFLVLLPQVYNSMNWYVYIYFYRTVTYHTVQYSYSFGEWNKNSLQRTERFRFSLSNKKTYSNKEKYGTTSSIPLVFR